MDIHTCVGYTHATAEPARRATHVDSIYTPGVAPILSQASRRAGAARKKGRSREAESWVKSARAILIRVSSQRVALVNLFAAEISNFARYKEVTYSLMIRMSRMSTFT